MKIGRNDPCPCGSGKKYKHCCLLKESMSTGDLINAGEYPVYSSQTENNGMLGRITTYMFDGEYLTWTTDGANAGTVFYRNEKFSVTNVCGVVDVTDDAVSTKYLFYALNREAPQYVNKGMGNPKLMSNVMARIRIPLPPLPVQQEIVRILDNFTELTAELNKSLEEEVSARRKQYEHYRDELLTFGDEVPKMPIAQCTERTKNIKWKENTAEYRYIDLTSVNLKNHQIESTTLISASDAPSRAQQLVKENDILFGTTRPMLQRQCLVPQCYDGQICSTGFCVLRTKIDVLLPEMLYYLMQTKAFYTYVERNQKGASYPSISDADVKRFEIPIVSIPEQKSIVTLLKHFDILCNDLTSGLPAEIAARQKQYEYYRDKLLTFKELEG